VHARHLPPGRLPIGVPETPAKTDPRRRRRPPARAAVLGWAGAAPDAALAAAGAGAPLPVGRAGAAQPATASATTSSTIPLAGKNDVMGLLLLGARAI
jgi:hypothetical protein